MSAWFALFWHGATPWLFGLALVLAALLQRRRPADRATVRHTLAFAAAALCLHAAATALAHQRLASAAMLHQLALVGIGWVLIRLGALVLFRLLLPALGMRTPGIVEDIVAIGGYLLWGMIQLSQAGVELTSLVATSAVITAVVAFAMQDTLGNVLGGLALQLDDSLQIGDWVRVDDISGRVVEIHWRFTALLTRNGERVVIPNAQLMKGKFTVIEAGHADEGRWRRWVWFPVDYAVAPSQVIAAAERALADADIPNVARVPAPSCVLMEFAPGSARYALRYWLINPQDDDPTDSAVRMHLLASLQRNGWRIALPDQTVHLVQDSDAHRQAVWERELARRMKALAGVELFAALDDAERRRIAERLVPAPFARGDVVTHQGAAAHWLYLIVGGEADVFWQAPNGERHLLSRLPPGSICGEMGLMTGAPRSATVVAHTDIECYRLDKASFEDILRERHAIAESISNILAQRQQQSQSLHAALAQGTSDAAPAELRADILQRIREFFGLG